MNSQVVRTSFHLFIFLLLLLCKSKFFPWKKQEKSPFSDVSNIKKPIRIIFTSSEMVCQRIMLSWSLIIDINVKNIKNDKILWEKHSLGSEGQLLLKGTLKLVK